MHIGSLENEWMKPKWKQTLFNYRENVLKLDEIDQTSNKKEEQLRMKGWMTILCIVFKHVDL